VRSEENVENKRLKKQRYWESWEKPESKWRRDTTTLYKDKSSMY